MFTQLNKEGTSPSFYRWRCWSIEVGWLAQWRQSQESTQRLLLFPGSSVTYPFSYGRDIAGEPVPCLACTDQKETFKSPPRSIYEVRPTSFVSCLPRPIPVEARKAICSRPADHEGPHTELFNIPLTVAICTVSERHKQGENRLSLSHSPTTELVYNTVFLFLDRNFFRYSVTDNYI